MIGIKFIRGFQCKSRLFTSVAMTPLKDSGKMTFPCSPSWPTIHLVAKDVENAHQITRPGSDRAEIKISENHEYELERILPHPLDNGGGGLKGWKIGIVDNLGEVIHTCNQ